MEVEGGEQAAAGLGQNLQREGSSGEVQPRVAGAGKDMELNMLDRGGRAKQGGWMGWGCLRVSVPALWS